MAKGKFEVVQTIPSPSIAAGLVERFGRKSYGVVTSFSDSYLGALRTYLGDSTLVDLKPFGEFVRQVHTQLHGSSPRLASSRQVLTAIELACESLPSLGPFSKVGDKAGFHEVVRDALRQFQHWDIGFDSVTDGFTGAKAEALHAIATEVERTLAEASASTASALMKACLDEALDLDGQEARLLIFNRGELHPLALKWLTWLSSQGAEVQLVLDRHATDAPIFRASQVTAEFVNKPKTSPGQGNRLLNNLFTEFETDGPDLELVEIHTVGDPFAEAEWALRRAVALTGTGSVTIFARDRDTYLPVLIAASQRMRVPVRLTRRTPLLANGFIKSLLALFDLLESNDVRKLTPLLKTGYLGLAHNSETANLIEQAHLRGGNEWGDLTELVAEKEGAELLAETVTHLRSLRSTIASEQRTALDWHTFVRNSIEQAPWFQIVIQRSHDGRDQRAFTALLAALGQDAVVRHANRPEPIAFATWIKVLKQVLDSGDASVPKPPDGIEVVTSVDEIGLTDYVIALGLLEGAFPRRRSENPILSDDDLAAFPANPPLTNSFDTAAAERDHFYRLCACPSKGLVLSYPQIDGDRDNIAAFYLGEIRKICSNLQEFSHPRRSLLPPPSECELEPDRALSTALLSAPKSPPENHIATEPAKEVIRFDKSPIRPRELRAMQKCAFQFLAQRKLPTPQEKGDYWRRLLYVPEMAQLLKAPDPESAATALRAAYQGVLDEIRTKLPAWELDPLEQGAERVFSGLIEREFMSREQWHRDCLTTKIGGRLEDFNPATAYKERLAGVTEANSRRTLHLYRLNAPEKKTTSNRDDLLLEFGSMIESAWVGVHEVEIEIESLGDRRTKIIYIPDDSAHPRSTDALTVINLGEGEATRDDLRTTLKGLFIEGLRSACSGQMLPTPGDHCAFCNVSDLCRRSQGASEEEDMF